MNRILQAAGEEFKRSGYTGTTTASIARNADVTEAQLFRYFGSKSNLFREAVFKPLDEELLKFIEQHTPESGGKGEFIHESNLYTEQLQHFISENVDMLASLVVAQTYDKHDAQGLAAITSLSAYFDHGAAVMTKRGKDRPKVEPKLMVRVSFAAVLACVMFKDWIFPPGLASDEEIRAAINDFVVEGISANFDR